MRRLMPWVVTCALLALLQTGCSNNKSPGDSSQAGFKAVNTGYYAIDPIPLLTSLERTDRTLPDPDLSTLTSMGTVTSQRIVRGTLDTSIAGSTGNLAADDLVLYSDNLVYRIMVRPYTINLSASASVAGVTATSSQAKAASPKIPVSLVVGIGSRIEGKLRKVSGGTNISSIPGFSLAVTGENNSAYASVHTVGVLSPTLVRMPRFSGKITEENLYTFFQNLAIINSEIYSPEAEIVPHIMGFYVSGLPSEVELHHIATAIRDEATGDTLTNILKHESKGGDGVGPRNVPVPPSPDK